MLKINELVKIYGGEIDIGSNPDNNKKPQLIQSEVPFTLWPVQFLPEITCFNDKSSKNLDYLETLSKKDLLSLKGRRLTALLSSIELLLFRNINAEDLIGFNGRLISQPLSHIQNYNKALVVWFIHDFETKKLLKILKYSAELKNYNLINITIKALQNKKLDRRQVNRISRYKALLNTQEKGIFPFEWLLKDCEDSNLNVDSEIASLRFCKIIEKLKDIKEVNFDFPLREKYKFIVFNKLWMVMQQNIARIENSALDENFIYLVL